MKQLSDLAEESIRLYEIGAALQEVLSDDTVTVNEMMTLKAIEPVLRASAQRVDLIARNQAEAARLMLYGLRHEKANLHTAATVGGSKGANAAA